tara:strand:+ start:337 stop:558 length:222 start_codon:yes stop_codon:yes gene_type:complete
MLTFTYPTTHEKTTIMLCDDIDMIKQNIHLIRKRVDELQKQKNIDGMIELTNHLEKIEHARCRPKPKSIKKCK